MKDLYSLPAYAQGIKFEYSNWEEVIQILGMNGVEARGAYSTRDGNIVPPGTLTEYRVILIKQKDTREILRADVGDWIVKFEDKDGAEFIPLPDALVKQQYVEDPLDIGNGQHTFRELYKNIENHQKSMETAVSLLKEARAFILTVQMTDKRPIGEGSEDLADRISEVLVNEHVPVMTVIKND